MAVSVLIVEDDQVTALALQQRLTRIGCEVAAIAADPAAALAKFRELRPDLVTLDINLPESGGSDAVALFKTMRAENHDCEIIVVSGTGFPQYREMFRGVIGYFTKPINFQEIATTLRKYFPELKPFKPDRAL
jgi:two-component system, chemotaxis family, chemotaxis protein CheY